MKVTTIGIIKMLPFEKQFQLKLLDQYDGDKLNPDQKFAIEQMVWDTYEAFYKLKLQENLQDALLKVKTHQEKLDKDLYVRAKQLTERQMENDFSQNTASIDISHIRAKLESLIKGKDNPTSPPPPSSPPAGGSSGQVVPKSEYTEKNQA